MSSFNTLIYTGIGRDKTRAAHYAAQERRLVLPVGSPLRLLDIGCGSGEFLLRLKEKFGARIKATGFDPASKLIAQAQTHACNTDLKFECKNATTFETTDRFDGVISTLVLPYGRNWEGLCSMFTCAAYYCDMPKIFRSVTFNPAFVPTGEEIVAGRRFEDRGERAMRIHFLDFSKPFHADATLWTRPEYEDAADYAGFSSIRWEALHLDRNSKEITTRNANPFDPRQPYIILEVSY